MSTRRQSRNPAGVKKARPLYAICPISYRNNAKADALHALGQYLEDHGFIKWSIRKDAGGFRYGELMLIVPEKTAKRIGRKT